MSFLKKLFAPVDMTVGRPVEKIILFSIPMLIGNIAQQLYSTVDSVVVGRYVGDNALAAVGSAAPILNLLLVLFVGISMGVSIMVSQYFGAKNKEELARTIGNCMTLTLIASVIIMVLSFFVVEPLLIAQNTPEIVLAWSRDYLMIFLLGIAGFAYYNILSGILRGLGDSVSALIYLLISTVINTVLDLLFVAVFEMGVPGVALATIIAQGLSSLLCFRKLLNMKESFTLHKKDFILSSHHCRRIIKLGLPSGLTQAIFSLAMIALQSLTNSFGEMFMTANVIIMRIDGFAMMPNMSFGTAMTTFSGQNVGAKKLDRLARGTLHGTLVALGVSAVITTLILTFGESLMGFFTETPELIALSMSMMRYLAIGYLAFAVMQCLAGVMRGAGDTLTPMWISIITTLLIRIPLAYGLVWFTTTETQPLGLQDSVFISLLISWVMGALITFICFKRGKWKKALEKNEA